MMVSVRTSWSTTIQASIAAGIFILELPLSMELVASTLIFVTSHFEDISRGVKIKLNYRSLFSVQEELCVYPSSFHEISFLVEVSVCVFSIPTVACNL